jgi:hypothetical protein
MRDGAELLETGAGSEVVELVRHLIDWSARSRGGEASQITASLGHESLR